MASRAFGMPAAVAAKRSPGGGGRAAPPLEPPAVVAEAVGRAGNDEPSNQVRPVEGELQRDRSPRRDAEHVDRRVEAGTYGLRAVSGEVGHGCSSLQTDLPPYPVHPERTRQGGEQPQLPPNAGCRWGWRW